MGLMRARRQGDLKYPTSTLVKSSSDLGWSNLFAELRSHSPCENPGPVHGNLEVAIAVRRFDEGLVACKVAGIWRPVRPTPGTIWLCPTDAKADMIRFASREVQILHLYVPGIAFLRLMDDYNLPALSGQSIRYSSGVQDEVINQIGLSVLSEMMSPTAAGRMLVETSSLLLAARLAHSHLETEFIRLPVRSRHRLDDRRLRRVLAYIEEHVVEDITVADLANVACLSIWHFTHAFAATMGVPPHRYVSQRRLERAKAMIASRRASLAEIAIACQFSSQSSFTRAFRRATGITPAEYRHALR
jgi:AraC family transcriptional regulator